MKRIRGSHLSLAALACVLVGLALLYKPAFIRLHRARMEWAREKVLETPPHLGAQGDYMESCERSRDALVRLGYLAKREFRLKHIHVPSQSSRRFWRLVTTTFPGNYHVTMQGYEPRTPDALITWDRPARIAEWERFVEKFDAENFDELCPAALEGAATRDRTAAP